MTNTTSAAPGDAEIDAQWRESVEKHETTAAFVRDFARAVLAKWGTPPAVAGEPVAWLSVDCIGERYLCLTKPDDSDSARPPVFGGATAQLAPGEGIEDAVGRLAALVEAQQPTTHAQNPDETEHHAACAPADSVPKSELRTKGPMK